MYDFMLESDGNLSGLAGSNFDENLDATYLSLGYFESENKEEIVDLTHSFPMHPFSTPWKYKKTVMFSDVFRG